MGLDVDLWEREKADRGKEVKTFSLISPVDTFSNQVFTTHHRLFDRRRFALSAGNKHKGQQAVHVRLSHTDTHRQREHVSFVSYCTVCIESRDCLFARVQCNV